MNVHGPSPERLGTDLGMPRESPRPCSVGPWTVRNHVGTVPGPPGAISVQSRCGPRLVPELSQDQPVTIPGSSRERRGDPGLCPDRPGTVPGTSQSSPSTVPGLPRDGSGPRTAPGSPGTIPGRPLDNPGRVAGLSPDRPGIAPLQSLDRPGIIPARSRDCLRMIPGPSRDSPWNANGHHLPPKTSATSNSVQLSPRLNRTP